MQRKRVRVSSNPVGPVRRVKRMTMRGTSVGRGGRGRGEEDDDERWCCPPFFPYMRIHNEVLGITKHSTCILSHSHACMHSQ